jgi:hypothetical protein
MSRNLKSSLGNLDRTEGYKRTYIHTYIHTRIHIYILRTTQDREEWRGLIREPRPDIGLLCHRRGCRITIQFLQLRHVSITTCRITIQFLQLRLVSTTTCRITIQFLQLRHVSTTTCRITIQFLQLRHVSTAIFSYHQVILDCINTTWLWPKIEAETCNCRNRIIILELYIYCETDTE